MPVELRKVESCYLCGTELDSDQDLFRKLSGLLQCSECKLVHTAMIPNEADLPKLYEGHKMSREQRMDARDFDPPTLGLIDFAKDYAALRDLRKIYKRIEIGDGGPLVDFGCGNGRYAAQLSKSFPNREIIAVDFQAEPPPGLDGAKQIRYLKVEEYLASGISASFVMLRHVLEHSLSPAELIQKIVGTVQSGAWIYIEVPNIESRLFTLTRMKWVGLYLPRHIHHFSKSSLTQILNSFGTCSFVYKKNPPVMGNQLSALLQRNQMTPLMQIIGGLLHPLQLVIEAGSRRGVAFAVLLRVERS